MKRSICRIAPVVVFQFGLAILSSERLWAADACPDGVKREMKEGGDDQVSWSSFATLEKMADTDWCYHRQVSLKKDNKRYVDWPLGEVHKTVVEKELITRSCCYPEPRTEQGPLEHGYQGTRIQTDVYRGKG